jgi:phosphoglycolate phosphatase
MQASLAIFDFDGTLADSLPWFLEAFNAAAERFGLRTIDAAEAEALRGCSAREILKRLEAPVWRVPAMARHMRKLKAEAAASIALFPGVADTLRALKTDGVRLAIVSSDSEPSIRTTLGQSAALIDDFDCSASLFGKAAKIRDVVRASGVDRKDAIYVGDETRDAEAAAKAGVRFGAVAWGYATRDALITAGATTVFDRTEDLRRIGRDGPP